MGIVGEIGIFAQLWLAFGLGVLCATLLWGVAYRLRLRTQLLKRTAMLSRRVADRDAALAEMKEEQKILHRQTNLDPLTGTANRRFFDDMLDQEWRRAGRGGTNLSLIMIDVDHFKSFNDSYGHMAGDEALRQVAQTAAAALKRPGDIFARYGGEEFVAVLPDTTLKGARTVAQQIATEVAALAIPNISSRELGIVTVSCGVASTVPSAGGRLEDLVETADQLLYTAKKEGRNRIMVQGDNLKSCRPDLHLVEGSLGA